MSIATRASIATLARIVTLARIATRASLVIQAIQMGRGGLAASIGTYGVEISSNARSGASRLSSSPSSR